MPEIAEVETVRRTLCSQIIGKKITRVTCTYPKIIENDIDYFKKSLLNQTFKDVKRKGKWLIFELNKYYLLTHLRMEGKFLYQKNNKYNKHNHVAFKFNDDTFLIYQDVRKFGRMKLILKKELKTTKEIASLGKEIIDETLDEDYLYDRLKYNNTAIKKVLLDQSVVSGLGNIYVCEILFACGISPFRPSSSITMIECEDILREGRRIINKAIKEGGTTVKSYSSNGYLGNYQKYLQVYKREGEKCFRCNHIVECIKQGGRSTYFCSYCQK